MTTKQVANLNRDTWKCDGCLGVWAEDSPKPDTATPAFKTNSKCFADNLLILQWNADAITAKIQHLRDYIMEKKVDVFLIQETKLVKKDKTPTFPGYTVLRKDRRQLRGKENNRGGGLLVGVREQIPFREATLDLRGEEDEITESITIEIPRNGAQKLRLTNVYIPPIRNTASETARQRKSVVTMSKWPCKQFDCILGDFNAHASTWNEECSDSDARGQDIDEWMASATMQPLNDPKMATRNSRHDNNKDSSPDISMVHSSLADKFSFWKPENDLDSDHKPILMLFNEQTIPEIETKAVYKWNFKGADWAAFTAEVDSNIPSSFHRKTNAHKLEKRLRNIITKAANAHVKKKKVTNKTKPGLTTEIKEAIKERNKLRKTRAANRREWVEACHKVKDMTRDAGEELERVCGQFRHENQSNAGMADDPEHGGKVSSQIQERGSRGGWCGIGGQSRQGGSICQDLSWFFQIACEEKRQGADEEGEKAT